MKNSTIKRDILSKEELSKVRGGGATPKDVTPR